MGLVETSISIILNGLSLGIVYVLLAVGLSVVFGVMQVINFSHGELLSLGAYFAVVVGTQFGGGGLGFVTAIVVAPLLVGLVGVGIERFTLQRIYDRNPLFHILLTFGIVLIINDAIVFIWGPTSKQIPLPEILANPITAFGFTYSMYNLFMIVAGALITASGWILLNYTRTGLIIRAGAQDRERVKYFGINIDNYYSLVFGFGAMLAGVAGVIFGGYQNVNPNIGMSVIIFAFVVVIVGGIGSYKGAIVVGLAIGIIQSLIQTYLPAFDGTIVFLLLIGVLINRPEGLFGTRLRHRPDQTLLSSYDRVLNSGIRMKLAGAILAALLLVPFGVGTLYSENVATLAIEVLIWGLFGLSLDFLMGYTGMVSLGHAMFFGIGAYTAVLTVLNITPLAIVALGLVVAISAVTALVVGYVSTRVTGIYFALITLGFAELLHSSLFNFEFTGGSNGLFGATPTYGVPGFAIDITTISVGFGGIRVHGEFLFFYIALAFLVGSYLLLRRVLRSPFGRVLRGIRENEERVRFAGYNTVTYKRQAFVISGTMAGLAGGLFGLHWGFVAPSVAHWLNSGEVLIMVITGGIGTLYGSIVGAGFFIGADEILSKYFEQSRMLLGIIFVLFVIFLPGGLVSLPARFQRQLSEFSTSVRKANKRDQADRIDEDA
jgi:branched-chain amino acid transport system permease protein